MNKYIEFDIACKEIVACVVESGKKDIYKTLPHGLTEMLVF